MKVTIEITPDNPGGAKDMVIESTENPNFVAVEVAGHWYDILVEDLYRATLPYMDKRHEERDA